MASDLQSIRLQVNFSAMWLLVQHMNEAFGNPKGDPSNINWNRIAKQAMNIPDEFGELFVALGCDRDKVEAAVAVFKTAIAEAHIPGTHVNRDGVRDALCDINVFSLGGHHLMGIDADKDMQSVIAGVMSRFVKDQADLDATLKKHAAKGVTQVYTEGTFPTLIVKSAIDQPDAPQGKFLKSASYCEPVFYEPVDAADSTVGRDNLQP